MHTLNFGSTLKKLRVQNNLTRVQLAKALGIKYAALSNYENNYREPNIKMLKVIASFFRISMDSLIAMPRTTTNVTEKDIVILAIIEEAKKMSANDRQLMVKLMLRLNNLVT